MYETMAIKEILNYIKDIWVPPNYTELLKLFENKRGVYGRLFSIILNIILVKLGARPSTLIVLEDVIRNNKDMTTIIDIIIGKMDMVKTSSYKKKDGNFFVTNDIIIDIPKNDQEVGKLLGYECADHDYYLLSVDRISYKIYEKKTNIQIYVELCEKDKISDLGKMKIIQEQKVQKWNDITNGIIPYSFYLKIRNIPAISYPVHNGNR